MSRHTPLQEVVFDLVESGKKESPEFQMLIKWFGKEKLRKLYADEREKRRSQAAARAEKETRRFSDEW